MSFEWCGSLQRDVDVGWCMVHGAWCMGVTSRTMDLPAMGGVLNSHCLD